MAERIDDGGPAYPICLPGWGDNGASGMSLRDYFAGQAIPAVVARCAVDTLVAGETMENMFARKSYLVADAMIAARKATA